MLVALLIMVREGFEAALIIAILYAYLRRIGRLDLQRPLWLGVGAGLGLSAVAGVVIRATVGELAGAARLRAFAVISLVAAAVLTWMVFWMRTQARMIKGELQHSIDHALTSGDVRRAVTVAAFVAVLREGFEAALFLIAATTAASPASVVAGAIVGLTIAGLLGYLVVLGGKRLPMATFFKVTGLVVIVFAAGLLARAVLFLQAAGDLGTLHDNIYDLTSVTWLTQQSEVGKFLAAMLGWDPRPSLEQVLAWVAYLVPVTLLFLRPARSSATPPPAGPAPVTEPARQTART